MDEYELRITCNKYFIYPPCPSGTCSYTVYCIHVTPRRTLMFKDRSVYWELYLLLKWKAPNHNNDN